MRIVLTRAELGQAVYAMEWYRLTVSIEEDDDADLELLRVLDKLRGELEREDALGSRKPARKDARIRANGRKGGRPRKDKG